MEKTRLYKWDNVKFFLILGVVLVHFSNSILGKSAVTDAVFIYGLVVIMPLFIFINGLFTKSYREKPLNGSRIFGLLMICLIYKLLIALAYLHYNRDELKVSILSDDAAPWYLFALVILMCLTYVLRNIKPAYVLIFSIILALLAGYDTAIGKEYTLSRIIYFFPYFYMGYILDPYKVGKALNKLWLKIVAVVGLAASMIFTYINVSELVPYYNLATGGTGYYNIENQVGNVDTIGMTQRLITYIIAIILSIFIISIMPNIRLPFISDMGTRTLQIYVLHRPILLIIEHEHVLSWIKNNITYSHWAIPWLLVGVILTLILSLKIFEKPFNKIMDNKITSGE